jgi:hypothetical protein
LTGWTVPRAIQNNSGLPNDLPFAGW